MVGGWVPPEKSDIPVAVQAISEDPLKQQEWFGATLALAVVCTSLGGCLWHDRRDGGVYVESRRGDPHREDHHEDRHDDRRDDRR